MTEDPKLSQQYRELPREEPSAHLDAAIRAAARRAAETQPAPLVVPSGRRRWYFPLAAAAIIVLAVAVTVHVERERPDPELAVATAPVEKGPAEEQAKPAARPETAKRDVAPAPPQKPFGAAETPAQPAAEPPPPPPAREATRADELARERASAETRE